MELEPKSLNIPLRKRSWSSLQIAAGAMLVGWLWHRPTEFPLVLVSCFLGGAAVWLCLASPFVLRGGTHRVPLARGITIVLAVAGLVFFMQKVMPYAHKLVT